MEPDDRRSILHCDLDNFFASVETLYNESYRNVPMAVCGSVEDRHGIVLAKNPIAKAFGVKTAEPIWQAKKKCPNLVVADPHYDRYVKYSHIARSIYEDYTDMIEPFGIDECWLDVTGSSMLFGTGEDIAREINRRMKAETGLTVSVGVSFNKCFAKLGSDLNKPDGISVITKENYRSTVWPLPVESLLWVGHSTLNRLNNLGIYTVGDVAEVPAGVLKSALGVNGEKLQMNALGLDRSPVMNNGETREAKSIGKSVTGRTDLKNSTEVYRTLLHLSEHVSAELRQSSMLAGAVQIYIRDTELESEEHVRSLPVPTRFAKVIADTAFGLYEEFWDKTKPIRSIGVRAQKLTGENAGEQLCLGHDYKKDEKSEKLETSIEKLRHKFGSEAVTRASLMKK